MHKKDSTKIQRQDERKKRTIITIVGEGIRTVLYAIKLWWL